MTNGYPGSEFHGIDFWREHVQVFYLHHLHGSDSFLFICAGIVSPVEDRTAFHDLQSAAFDTDCFFSLQVHFETLPADGW